MDLSSQHTASEQSTNGELYRHVLALNPSPFTSTAWMGAFPPTGLEYIAASIKNLVGKVTLIDMRFEVEYCDLNKLNDFIRNEIDLLCISIVWRSGFNEICDFVNKLPQGITTVVGGHKATEEVDNIFVRCPNVNLIVRGEGEEIIRQVVTGVPYAEIAGLSYRENGKIIHNKNATLPSIEKLPFPDRSLRRCEYEWLQNGVKLMPHTFDTILTSRGCPFKCKFCTFSLNPLGQKREYTERPLESVIEELKTVTADLIMIADDNFFTNPKRAEKLCDMIIESGIKKIFVVQTRIDVSKHPSLLDKAARAGIRILLLGIESPHDWILKLIDKGFNQQQIREAIQVLRKYPFYLHAYFIYGNIGETEEEMVYIGRFAKEIGLDSISFQKLRIEKFSPLKEIVENTPGYHYDEVGGPVYSDKFDLAALKKIRNRIRSEFYDFAQLMWIIRKFMSLGLLSKTDVMRLLFNVPRLLFVIVRRGIKNKASRLAGKTAKLTKLNSSNA
ncbi:MAG: radical SAM protein [Kiritimatiellae bacterium]|nr:radical SAM protein [Kiritimatiellia bacterium]MDD5519481.1 radical SAM protein [Kiritimatiellia bacterium]